MEGQINSGGSLGYAVIAIIIVLSVYFFVRSVNAQSPRQNQREKEILTKGLWGMIARCMNKNNGMSNFWISTIEHQDVIICHYRFVLYIIGVILAFLSVVANKITPGFALITAGVIWYIFSLIAYGLIKIRAAHLLSIEGTDIGAKAHEAMEKFTYWKWVVSPGDRAIIIAALRENSGVFKKCPTNKL